MRIVQYLKWMRRRDGGVVNTCMLLCPMLAAIGHEVTLITCEDEDVPGDVYDKVVGAAGAKYSRRAGVPLCVRVALADPFKSITGRSPHNSGRDEPTQVLPRRALAVCADLLASTDVLHLHGPWPTSHVQLARIARRLRVPYVVSPHGMLDDWCMQQGGFKKRLHLSLLGKRLMDHARCVHFEGQEEGRQGRVYTRAPVAIGPPPPIDGQPFRGLPGPEVARRAIPALASGDPVVVFLSRLTMKKGPDVLLRAARLWKDQGRRVTTVLAGKGDPPAFEDHLRALAQELGIADRCVFPGLVTGELKWSLLQAADLVVLPTLQENWGIVLIEALACGTPIITTRAVDTWPEFEESGGAVIIDGGAEQLAGAVGKLLADPARRKEMGARGRAWALKTWEPKALAGAYATMLAGAGAGAGVGR